MIPTPGWIGVGQHVFGDVAHGDDGAIQVLAGLGQEDRRRIRVEQVLGVTRDAVHHRRQVQRRRDVATDLGQRGRPRASGAASRRTAARSRARRSCWRPASAAVARPNRRTRARDRMSRMLRRPRARSPAISGTNTLRFLRRATKHGRTVLLEHSRHVLIDDQCFARGQHVRGRSLLRRAAWARCPAVARP